MPVSDLLLSLALALHPQGDARLPLTLGADAVSQPDGGAAVRILASEGKIKGNVTTGLQKCDKVEGQQQLKYDAAGHALKYETPALKYETTRGHIKGEGQLKYETTAGHIKGEGVNACAAGQHFPK
jgi:hypothetical protein